MAKTIVGLFDNPQKTQMAIRELAKAGIPQNDIDCLTLNDNIAANGDISTRLMRAGVPREEIEHYSGEIDSGNSVLVLKVSDQAVQPALDVLERNGAKDLDQRSGSTSSAGLGQETTQLTQPGKGSRTTTVPVIEEELKVGKRQVQGGGIAGQAPAARARESRRAMHDQHGLPDCCQHELEPRVRADGGNRDGGHRAAAVQRDGVRGEVRLGSFHAPLPGPLPCGERGVECMPLSLALSPAGRGELSGPLPCGERGVERSSPLRGEGS